MDLRLFNTLTGVVEPVHPIHDRQVHMYHCGPTVYDYAHIGNIRTFIANDTLRRTLSYLDYRVFQVMNITDVDDKIIKRSKTDGVTLQDLTMKYENILLQDLRALNIQIPEHLPRATDHIAEMIVLISKLMALGVAYKTGDGIYFDVSQSRGYGALAHLNIEAHTESRVDAENLDKKNERDFAVWKFWSPEDGDCVHEAPFGKGRPGWHIECSAMAMKEIGETLDIHTGGTDLVFPHHTNEIAQSEAITGKPLANIWMHAGFLMIDGQKMSKSLNNHTTLKTITDRGYSPRAFRYYMLGTHYRTQANFTWEALDAATTALKKLSDVLGSELGLVSEAYRSRFQEIIAHDLDTPRALALAWEVAKDDSLPVKDKTATLLDFDRVLGLGLALKKEETIPDEVQVLLKARTKARVEKNWTESDKIREQITSLGYEVLDTPDGFRVSKIS